MGLWRRTGLLSRNSGLSCVAITKKSKPSMRAATRFAFGFWPADAKVGAHARLELSGLTRVEDGPVRFVIRWAPGFVCGASNFSQSRSDCLSHSSAGGGRRVPTAPSRASRSKHRLDDRIDEFPLGQLHVGAVCAPVTDHQGVFENHSIHLGGVRLHGG